MIALFQFVSCVERIKQKKQLLKFLSFHFANSTRWRERQVYILTVDKLLEHRAIKPEMFNNYILKMLLDLASDKIPNIRLCIAKCLSITLLENRKLKRLLNFPSFSKTFLFPFVAYYNIDFNDSRKHIQQQIATLGKDPDRDVRDNVYSAFSEKEKTEAVSPSPFDPALPEATQRDALPAELETVAPSAEKEKDGLHDNVLDLPTDPET